MLETFRIDLWSFCSHPPSICTWCRIGKYLYVIWFSFPGDMVRNVS